MSNPVVYDKAKWHLQGDFPVELPHQAFVHTGMFLAWIIEHDLYGEELVDHVQDTWDNYAAIKPVIEARYLAWRENKHF